MLLDHESAQAVSSHRDFFPGLLLDAVAEIFRDSFATGRPSPTPRPLSLTEGFHTSGSGDGAYIGSR